ncbi:MAG: hypothetical protein WCQ57_05080 [Verrucomicrobiota bacterium]
MKRHLLIAVCCLLPLGGLPALVVNPAPNIPWLDSTGKINGLSAFMGQPVIVLVAPSPRDRTFRAQVGQVQKLFERYAAQKVIFMVAFTQEQGRIGSNVPFVLAADGPRTAFDLRTGDRFGIAFIGRDGNLDYVTNKVIPSLRMNDILGASFVTQEKLRRP